MILCNPKKMPETGTKIQANVNGQTKTGRLSNHWARGEAVSAERSEASFSNR